MRLLLLLLLASPLRAFFGSKTATTGAPSVLLWVPDESFSAWAAVSDALKREESLKLAAGLTPEMITPSLLSEMGPWVKQGRVELALRLAGDPVLPLIAAERPQDPMERLAQAREDWRARLGEDPAGFVPGGGAVDARLASDLRSLDIRWVAVGNDGGDWASSSGLVFIPFKTVKTFGQLPKPQDLQAGAVLLDEADGFVPPGSLALSREPKASWSTVSQAALERRPAEVSSGSWPTWTGGFAAWTETPEQKRAWKLYGDAARALRTFQNSGTADLGALEAAAKELYAAQAGRYFRSLSRVGTLADLEKNDRELRDHLAQVYRRCRLAVPADLERSLLAQAAGSTGAEAGISRGENWLEFANAPARVLAAADLWTILSLRVAWDEKDLTLSYKMARLETEVTAPQGFGRLLLDTYIDLNGIVGAGSTKLLQGRGAFLQSRDAWEFALTFSGWGCALYRYDPRGEPVSAAKCAVAADLKAQTLTVALPRSVLRGNPSRWGYAAVALEAEKGSLRPAKGDAAAIRSFLEKPPGKGSPGIPERLAAVRLSAP